MSEKHDRIIEKAPGGRECEFTWEIQNNEEVRAQRDRMLREKL